MPDIAACPWIDHECFGGCPHYVKPFQLGLGDYRCICDCGSYGPQLIDFHCSPEEGFAQAIIIWNAWTRQIDELRAENELLIAENSHWQDALATIAKQKADLKEAVEVVRKAESIYDPAIDKFKCPVCEKINLRDCHYEECSLGQFLTKYPEKQ